MDDIKHPFVEVPEGWMRPECFETAKLLMGSGYRVEALNLIKNSILKEPTDLDKDQRELFFTCSTELLEELLKFWKSMQALEIEEIGETGGSAPCAVACSTEWENRILQTSNLINMLCDRLYNMKTDKHTQTIYMTLKAQSGYMLSNVLKGDKKKSECSAVLKNFKIAKIIGMADEDLVQQLEKEPEVDMDDLKHAFVKVPEGWKRSECFETAKLLMGSDYRVPAFNLIKKSILKEPTDLDKDQSELFFTCSTELLEELLKFWTSMQALEIEEIAATGGSAPCVVACSTEWENIILQTSNLINMLCDHLYNLKTDKHKETIYMTLKAQSGYMLSNVLKDDKKKKSECSAVLNNFKIAKESATSIDAWSTSSMLCTHFYSEFVRHCLSNETNAYNLVNAHIEELKKIEKREDLSTAIDEKASYFLSLMEANLKAWKPQEMSKRRKST